MLLLLVVLCFYGKEFISLTVIFFPCSHLHDDDDDAILNLHIEFHSIQPMGAMGAVRTVPHRLKTITIQHPSTVDASNVSSYPHHVPMLPPVECHDSQIMYLIGWTDSKGFVSLLQ